VIVVNISKKVGYVKVDNETIEQWRKSIREERDVTIENLDPTMKSLAKVYRADAKELLRLSTMLKNGIKISLAKSIFNSLDTIVREQVPENICSLLY
jgi:protease II